MQKKCKNCGVQFTIEDEDLKFYEKVSPVFNGKKYLIPLPELCSDCRQQRRLAFRNERMLYKSRCSLCGEPMISIYSPDKEYFVYCSNCFWGDKWNALSYGRNFDFSRSFFEQWKELWDIVPKLGLLVLGDNVNSDYTHDNYRLKNCYLVFDGEQAQDCYYGETFDHLKDSIDFLAVKHSELLYECVNCQNCYNLIFSRYCHNCSDSAFLIDCVGCKNCFGCANLHRKEYYIFNKPHTREEYEKKMRFLKLHQYKNLQKTQHLFEDFCVNQPKKVYRGQMNENVTGDNLTQCKNTFESYDCNGLRDCKFCTNMLMGANDCMDINIWGDRLNLAYNSAGVGAGAQSMIGCYYCGFDSNNIYHSAFCWKGSSDLFGCVGLTHKKYCILNKEYSKAEYYELVGRIARHMQKTGQWGEFFPIPLSSFGYNETVAQEYFPLTKEQAANKGYKWKDPDPKEYEDQTYNLPDDIFEIHDSITNEILACVDCGKNYKIIKQELSFYKKIKLPIPRKCPDCRHKVRMAFRNPRKLYNRKCDKCGIAIKTAYAPNRPEMIYCEQCYLKEIV